MTPNDPSGPGNDMPRLVPDRDEIAQRKRSGTVEKSRVNTPENAKSDSDGTASIWMKTLVFLLVIAVGGLGWMNFRLGQDLQTLSNKTDGRLLSLEGQLSATDESLAMNENSISAKMSNIMSEIRKLWDVSNKRNKAWIQENQELIATLQKNTSGTLAAIDDVRQSTGAVRARTETLALDQAAVASDVAEAEAELKSRLDELALSLQLLSDQAAAADETVQQDIESINANRLQVNQRLNSLQQQIQSLEERISGLAEDITQAASQPPPPAAQ